MSNKKKTETKSKRVKPHGWTEPRFKSRTQEPASRLLYLRFSAAICHVLRSGDEWTTRAQIEILRLGLQRPIPLLVKSYYVIGSGLLWHYSQLLADTFLAQITSTNIMLLAGLLHLQRSFIHMYMYIFNRDKFCPDSFWKVFGNQLRRSLKFIPFKNTYKRCSINTSTHVFIGLIIYLTASSTNCNKALTVATPSLSLRYGS